MITVFLQGLQEVDDLLGPLIQRPYVEQVGGKHVLHDARVGIGTLGVVNCRGHVQRLLHAGTIPGTALQFRHVLGDGRTGIELAGLDQVGGNQAGEGFGHRPQGMAPLFDHPVGVVFIDDLAAMQHQQAVDITAVLVVGQRDCVAIAVRDGDAGEVHAGRFQRRRCRARSDGAVARMDEVQVLVDPVGAGQLELFPGDMGAGRFADRGRRAGCARELGANGGLDLGLGERCRLPCLGLRCRCGLRGIAGGGTCQWRFTGSCRRLVCCR